MHFSEVEKGDFVMLMRMENVRQRVSYSNDRLLAETLITMELKRG